MTNLQKLSELEYQHRYSKLSGMPEYAKYKKKFTDKTANGLTKAIKTWLELHDCSCSRINSTGQYRDNSKIVQDVTGRKRKIGSGMWTKSGSTPGVSDLISVINGLSVAWEIKIKDKQSEVQKEWQLRHEKAGGKYFIVRSFDEFILIFDQLCKK